MSDMTPYLTLGLGQETFGIAVRHVHEILDMRPIAALPQAPVFLIGMTDVRGVSYPVIDLRIKLGLPPEPVTPETRIIILQLPIAGRVTGVRAVADRVFEVTRLDGERLDPAPEVGGRWRSAAIAGIGRKAGAFVMVFDPEQLMDADTDLLLAGDRITA